MQLEGGAVAGERAAQWQCEGCARVLWHDDAGLWHETAGLLM